MAKLRISSNITGRTKPFRIGPGLVITDLPLQGDILLSPQDVLGDVFSQVNMTIDLVDGVLQPTTLSVTAADGTPVTGSALRQVPVRAMADRLIVLAVQEGKFTGDPGGAWGFTSTGSLQISAEDVQRVRQQGPVDESLVFVSNLYELGRVMGRNPVKFVEDNMGMPRTTITQWVRRARDRGILGNAKGRDDGVDS